MREKYYNGDYWFYQFLIFLLGGAKRPSRKKKPLSGLLTNQIQEAKEIEKRRINEVIYNKTG